jgi:uncharacterized protein YdiU (UPF0061 family)
MTGFGGVAWDTKFLGELPGDPREDNSPREVMGAAWSRVHPTPVAAPALLAWSPEVANIIGFSEDLVTSPAFAAVFGGNQIGGGMDPYSACYGGHQFGNWAGQLGDGRAITLGEIVHPEHGRWELQLKGAGPTPYSRSADGRAVLRSSIREFLCSEAMHHLGVPTTRALCLVGTGEPILRDMFYDGNVATEPGAIVCRVAPTFLRFGSYQIHTARGDVGLLRTLVEHTLCTHFPHLGSLSRTSVLAWLREVAARTARMVAEWMRVGFVHGVMNTDNMSILGLTIDYGPYGWIDAFDNDWTPNTTDFGHRRYRFGYQPSVAEWNLTRLAEAMYPLIEDVPALEEALRSYDKEWTRSSREMITRKLGLSEFKPETDGALWDGLVATLQRVETDMTLFFRALSTYKANLDLCALPNGELLLPIVDAFYDPDAITHDDRRAWAKWLRSYIGRIEQDGKDDAERARSMNLANPKYVLRNYMAQEAIDLAEKGDMSLVVELLDLLRRPYDEQVARDAFAVKRPEWARNKPGCSTLSCSS